MEVNDDIKICLNELIENRVIFEQSRPDVYRLIKKRMIDIRKICLNDLGLQLLINPKFIKLEKIPEEPRNYMGFEGLIEPEDYVMFACSMAYLEEAGPDTPFLLNNLTDSLQRSMSIKPDWNEFQTRRRLVRVLKQMMDFTLIKSLDGDFSNYGDNENEEALFIVTSYSRYFLRSFPDNLQSMKNWHELLIRNEKYSTRIRVIQRLLFTPGICRTSDTEELFNYMRHQESFLIGYFEKYTDFNFELTKNVALLASPNRRKNLKYIPDGSSSGDLLMIIGFKICDEKFDRNNFGQIRLSFAQWQSIVGSVFQENKELLSKTYRDMSLNTVSEKVLSQTNQSGLTFEDDSRIVITPLLARLNGKFNGPE